jgi:hypothetical protein
MLCGASIVHARMTGVLSNFIVRMPALDKSTDCIRSPASSPLAASARFERRWIPAFAGMT